MPQKKFVAMECAKADSNQLWFFDNPSNLSFNEEISPLDTLT